ncbi:MAG TPA: hypothetical protein VGM94_15520 [Galbitalea sp.]
MFDSPELPASPGIAWGSVIAVVVVIVIAAVAIILARTIFRTDRPKGKPSAAETFLQRVMDDPDSLDKK